MARPATLTGSGDSLSFDIAESAQKAPSPSTTIHRAIHPLNVNYILEPLGSSLILHSGLSVAAWAAGRATNRLESKDWLWPAGQVANAWWCAIGRRVVYENITVQDAWRFMPWNEQLLLGGVTAWGLRLFYRIARRSLERGKDDPRYAEVKEEQGFWNKALFTTFLPEALFQSIIAIPFTAAFKPTGGSPPPAMTGASWGWVETLGVGLFSAGFALEVLADKQLADHKKAGAEGIVQDGVWSIVRHPNYLGDALIHSSFPLLLFNTTTYTPLFFLGPLANYLFLRYVGGDKENEASQEARYQVEDRLKYHEFQEYKAKKNSFWPGVDELQNSWTWIVVGAGAAGVALERVARNVLNAHHSSGF